MTSDAISDEDWEPVRELAEKVAGVAECDDKLREKYSAELLKYLTVLESKYGEMPSILATKADYVSSPSVRLSLLKLAFNRAKAIGDNKNATYISSSLAETYVELGDKEASENWLQELENALGDYWDDDEYKTYSQLSERLSVNKDTL
jgi:hypothetical protein